MCGMAAMWRHKHLGDNVPHLPHDGKDNREPYLRVTSQRAAGTTSASYPIRLVTHVAMRSAAWARAPAGSSR